MKINLSKLTKVTTLRHRDTAKMIINQATNTSNEEEIIIDFNGIEFASRSFCHELKRGLKDKNVKYINMKQEVEEMMQLVLVKPKVTLGSDFKYKKLKLPAS